MKLLVICFLLLSVFSVCAQINAEQKQLSTSDSIYVQKKGLGLRYFHQGKQINLQGISNLVKSNPEAKKDLRISKGLLLPTYLLSLAGGFMIGYEVGGAINGRKANMITMGAGIGTWATGIALGVVSDKKRASAIRKYNAGLIKQ